MGLRIAFLLALAFTLPGQYISGPRGGCYTYTRSGAKKYVDRSLCAAETQASPERPQKGAAAKEGRSVFVRIADPQGRCFELFSDWTWKMTEPEQCAPERVSAGTPGQKERDAAKDGVAEKPVEKTQPNTESGYTTGPKGGCYTITSSGRKRYVSRSNCQ